MYKRQFHDELCLLQDCATQQLKGIGEPRGGLYYLVNTPIAQISPQLLHKGHTLLTRLRSIFAGKFSANVVHTQADFSLWHKRLGHASASTLQHISIIPKVDQCKDLCLTCPMAKFVKLPYVVSSSHAAEPFDLVHIDIWGAYRVPAHGKYRYFLTGVDDYSRATWIYLLHHKSQALSVIQKFWQYVKTHFGKHIKTLRSDNALEFESGPCEQFFSEHSILHQTSCVDRPQQNGRVERKHKHLLEISRALRFQAALPLHFWGDCVLAVA